MDEVSPLVSVIYTTYNHEKFISDALDSFLAQKCDFDFEIIVHDDCSTDASQEIIESYKLLHPTKIKTIYQDTNQWSKGTYPSSYFALKLARGRYIAFCDGDDYWTSPEKLQNQIDAMKWFGVDMSGHPALRLNSGCSRYESYSRHRVDKVQKFMPIDLIKNNGNMLPMSSIVVSAAIKDDFLANTPPVRFHTGLQLLGARRSGFCILPFVMSAYRVGVDNSATELLFGNNKRRSDTSLRKLSSANRLYKLYNQDVAIQKAGLSFKFYVGRLVFDLIKTDFKRVREGVSLLTEFSRFDKLIVLSYTTFLLGRLVYKFCARTFTKFWRNIKGYVFRPR